MTDKQIKEIMALVEKYGVECWNDGRLEYGFQTDYATQQARAAIESALRAAVPAIPEGRTNRERLLGEALGKCILASGIVRKDIEGFSGPELLMFADDLHEMLSASPQPVPVPAIPEVPALPPRVIECAMRLVAHADFQLGGCLNDKSKAKEIPSNAIANVKARHLAQLRDALSASPQAPQPAQPDWTEQTR
jgi:hypothetical protein